MKSIFQISTYAIITLLTFTQCDLFKKDPPIGGCTDNRALNYDFMAEESDGSCEYSSVTFYARFPAFNGIQIASIDLFIDGNNNGKITAIYPSSPGNCSAPGTVRYQFYDRQSVDWNTRILLVTGAELFTTGTVSPSRSSECIEINVTQ
jgi:hypothetical protein